MDGWMDSNVLSGMLVCGCGGMREREGNVVLLLLFVVLSVCKQRDEVDVWKEEREDFVLCV